MGGVLCGCVCDREEEACCFCMFWTGLIRHCTKRQRVTQTTHAIATRWYYKRGGGHNSVGDSMTYSQFIHTHVHKRDVDRLLTAVVYACAGVRVTRKVVYSCLRNGRISRQTTYMLHPTSLNSIPLRTSCTLCSALRRETPPDPRPALASLATLLTILVARLESFARSAS